MNHIGTRFLQISLFSCIFIMMGIWVYWCIKIKPQDSCQSWDDECHTEQTDSRLLVSY